MPYNGSGTYTPPGADFPAVTATVISSTKYNNVINDIATALTNAVTRDGQSPLTADFPMGGRNILNLALGTAAAPAVRWGTNDGLFSAGAGLLAISVGGASILSVAATGVTVTGVHTATGLLKGNNGGAGLGAITISSSAPSGGADGDLWFQT